MSGARTPFAKLLALVLLGFFVLSPMSSAIFASLSTPHLPELLGLPFVCIFWRDIRPVLRTAFSRLRFPTFVFLLTAWLFLLVFGLFHSPDVRGTLSCARSYFWILTIAFASRKVPHISGRTLLLVSLGSMAGSAADAWLRTGVAGEDAVHLGNIASTFHVAYLTLGLGNVFAGLLVTPLLVYRVIQSSFRQVLVAAFLAALLSIVNRLFSVRRGGGLWRIGAGTLALGVAIYTGTLYVDEIGLTPTQHNRLVARAQDVRDDGDAGRIQRFVALPGDFLSRPFPEGFPAKGYVEGDSEAMERHRLLMDLPVYELIVVFGGPLAALVYAWVLAKGTIACARSFGGSVALGDESLAMSFFLYVGLSWITGAFLWHSYEAAFFGLSAGRWWAISRGLRVRSSAGSALASANVPNTR